MNISARLESATAFLDECYSALRKPHADVHGAIGGLADELLVLRTALPSVEWQKFAETFVPTHSLLHLIHQDPLTRRCFYKPRGYAGDARMLDYIYGLDDDDDSTTLGRRILDCLKDSPAARAVRERRQLMASLIGRVSDRQPGARILAVACGHLREAIDCQAVEDGAIGELVALDQDLKSLAVVEQRFSGRSVTAVRASVGDLLRQRGASELGLFDLIYVTGLYDYLTDETARRVTERLWSMLNGRGLLVFANFLPGIRHVGYMEACMGWRLKYRTLQELSALGAGIPEEQVQACSRFADSLNQIGYLQMERTAPSASR